MAAARTALRLLLPLVIIGVAAGVVMLMMATGPQPEPRPAEARTWPVTVQAVRVGAHRPVLRLQGFLESPRTATLTSAVEGDIARVAHLEGETVAAGALLVLIDDRELRLALAERRAELAELQALRAVEERRIATDREILSTDERALDLTRRDTQRIEDLAEKKFTSPAAVDRAQRELAERELAVAQRRFSATTGDSRLEQIDARIRRARALSERAELNLARTRVAAPFGGRIAKVHVAPGDRVRSGEPLVSLYDTAALEIRAQVPSAHLSRLREALAAGKLQARALADGETLAVSLDRFAGRSEPGTGGVEALFRLDERADAMVLGRFASLELELPLEAGSVVLPFEALYDANRIYRVREGRMQALGVERLGESTLPDGSRGVLLRAEGLADGDRVVVTQLPQAMDGLRVQVLEK
jgi:HlyD family secretion protein